MPHDEHDLYAVLGVAPDASLAQIGAAYRRLVRANHPDLFPEEMVVRQGGEHSAGRLDAALTVYVYDLRKGRRL